MKKSLTRRERLSGNRDIEALFKKAERFESRIVRLLVRPNGLELNRMLVTVRRGCKNSPVRNRQKRILREIYRDCKHGLKQGFDLAFVLSQEESSFKDMRVAVTGLLRNAGMFAF